LELINVLPRYLGETMDEVARSVGSASCCCPRLDKAASKSLLAWHPGAQGQRHGGEKKPVIKSASRGLRQRRAEPKLVIVDVLPRYLGVGGFIRLEV